LSHFKIHNWFSDYSSIIAVTLQILLELLKTSVLYRPRPIFGQLTFRWGCTFLLVEKKKRKKKKKKRPFCNGFVTHAVRLRAYAISPCLSHLFFFALFRRRTSLQVALRAFPPLPLSLPLSSPRGSSSLFTIFLTRASLGIAAAPAESTRTGCPRWSNGTLAAFFPAHALSRIISRVYTAILPLSLTRFTWFDLLGFDASRSQPTSLRAFALSPYFPFFSPPPLSHLYNFYFTLSYSFLSI